MSAHVVEGVMPRPADSLPPAPASGLLPRVERAVEWVVERVAALLLVAEIVVLFVGVCARYVFHAPITWTEETATTLFIWLAMLGAVIAMRRSEHMRLGFVRDQFGERSRRWVDATALAVVMLFLGLLVWPAFEYVMDHAAITKPSLGISDGWRAAALPAGIVLMLLLAVRQLLREHTLDRVAGACAVVLVLSAALYAAQGLLAELGNLNLLLFFVAIVGVCIAIGVPIAFAFGAATAGYLALVADIPLVLSVNRLDEGMSHIILLAIPLFVFLGQLLEATGIARVLITLIAALVGHYRSGLSYVLLGSMYVVSGISGSKAADMAAIAPALFPEMRARGAKPGRLAALLSSSGAMSETIPPSLVLIAIGSVTGVSISALFVGGLLPAAVALGVLAVFAFFEGRRDTAAALPKASGRQIWQALWVALPALALPVIIRFAVTDGIATATEVSTIGVLYALIVGLLVYRRFDVRRILPMLVETASLSGAILIIIGMATGMAWALTSSGFSDQILDLMRAIPGGRTGFLAISILVFIVLGSLLEGIPVIVLLGPLLFPVARAMGIHEVHYSMVVILAMGVGLFMPPFGVGFYTACAIGKVPPDEAMRFMWPYLAAMLIALVLVAAFPWLSIGFLVR
ncbi:TRAP transporter large permease subunit [Xylophilus sp. GOD-11R]|uniref:TRAP transporter large permease n=1 Tax=Xylophilus sp. GOD-11R TaxID=3089814 RepID=UPI00298C230C|nr:TRAP transporter large permease subunit [Xylophilus sp. GOD-11R]WPB58261.1 TRAP transporter large permease subunit [Xylophilus sp. GOD-11R]